MIQSVTESIGGLINVEEYEIMWGEEDTYPFDLPLVNAGWPGFGKNLRKLSIHYPLNRLSAIFPPPVFLEKLRELDLVYVMRRSRSPPQLEATASQQATASSINPIVTIRSLRLGMDTMSSFFDLSPFFRTLKVFPRLETLSFNVPFNRNFLADPSALAHFINTHRHTLQHLTLHPGYLLYSVDMQDEVFCQVLSDLRSVDLLSIELYTSLLSLGSVTRCMKHFPKL